jgi:hypothetical protein
MVLTQHLTMIQAIAYIFGSIGVLVTGLSALIALFSFRRYRQAFEADHERRMRDFSVQLIFKWNETTLVHRKEIEKAFPRLLDVSQSHPIDLTKQDARDIYHATYASDPAKFELRFHLFSLLNFLEAVAVAYEESVASKEIIKSTFEDALTRYYKSLENFRAVVKENRDDRDNWEPLTELMRNWATPPSQGKRAPHEKEKRLKGRC